MPDRLNDPAHAQVPAEFKPVNWTREGPGTCFTLVNLQLVLR